MKGRIREYFTGNTNIIKNFQYWGLSLTIINDGNNDLNLIINDMNILIKAQEIFEDNFDRFRSITIMATDSYRVVIRG